jgi:DNA-binding MarR family transcriptional regulator
MKKSVIAYGRIFARVAEAYLSTLSRKVEPFGLDRYFVPLLHIVEHSGLITQKQLGKFLKKDKVSVLRTVNYLCEHGFVIRKQNKHDKREQFLAASAKGIKLAPIISKAIEETNALFFEDFYQKERNDFETSLGKLTTLIEKLPAPGFIIRAEKKNNLVFHNE